MYLSAAAAAARLPPALALGDAARRRGGRGGGRPGAGAEGGGAGREGRGRRGDGRRGGRGLGQCGKELKCHEMHRSLLTSTSTFHSFPSL